MIVETLLDLSMSAIQIIFSFFQVITLPTDLMTFLLDIICYGTWVVGADLMAIVMSTVTIFYGARFGAGLLLFLWRFIPLT